MIVLNMEANEDLDKNLACPFERNSFGKWFGRGSRGKASGTEKRGGPINLTKQEGTAPCQTPTPRQTSGSNQKSGKSSRQKEKPAQACFELQSQSYETQQEVLNWIV